LTSWQEYFFKKQEDDFAVFLREVAFKNMLDYTTIIQTGEREGQTYYDHALKGIFLIRQMKEIWKLDETEEKVLISAYAIHDMNKIPPYAEKEGSRKVQDCATRENVTFELRKLGIKKYFPNFEDYLYDISELIRGHSGSYNSSANIIRKKAVARIPVYRLEELKEAMRAVDVADLSGNFSETAKKRKFLEFANSIADCEYYLTWHRLTENRGVLSNVIHNRVAQYLEEKFDCKPVFLYPEGTYYLVSEDNYQKMQQLDLTELYVFVKTRFSELIQEQFEKFIVSRPSGIKIDHKCIELGVPFDRMLLVLDRKIQGKKYDPKMNIKIRTKTGKALKKIKGKNAAAVEKFLQEITKSEFLREEMQMGELLRSYYTFVKDNYCRGGSQGAWERIYSLVGLTDDEKILLEPFDPLFLRPYAVARRLYRKKTSYENLLELVREDGRQVLAGIDDQDEARDHIVLYLQRVLKLERAAAFRKKDFSQPFKYYVEKPHVQCSTCGQEFEVQHWMAGDVPSNISVQFFSNRLQGGKREPKRNICAVCNYQFILQKMNYAVLKNTETIYLHLYPQYYYNKIFIDLFRSLFENFRSEDHRAVLINNQRILKERSSRERVDIYFSGTRSNGLPVPGHSEVIGNIIILPLNAPGDNATQSFIYALQVALILMDNFEFRTVLTKSPVPVHGEEDFDQFYLDYLPESLYGFTGGVNFVRRELNKLWQLVRDLAGVTRNVANPTEQTKVYMKLMMAASARPELLFFEVDREIEKNYRNNENTSGIAGRVLPKIVSIIKMLGGNEMNVVRELAQKARDANIKGKTFKRNSISKPLDMIFDGLEKRNDRLELDITFAAIKEDIFAHIERIAGENYKPGKGKREKISDYVETFREKLLNQKYGGNINSLLAEKDIIKSAYLFYYQSSGSSDDEKEN